LLAKLALFGEKPAVWLDFLFSTALPLSPRKRFVGSIGANLLEPAGVHLLVAAFLVAGEVVGEGEADAAVGAHL